jgi:putative ATP-dependent endonuclease of OLD family
LSHISLDFIGSVDAECECQETFWIWDLLGKSNILSLLNTVFCHRSFDEDDFRDPTKPIQIGLRLKLADVEIGHFHDLFDSSNYTNINVDCVQTSTDTEIEFSHSESRSYIPQSLIRSINYIHYTSLRNPVTEITFDKGRGVGRFLYKLVSQYLKENNVTDKDFLDAAKVEGLIDAINERILKVKSFKDFGISATPDDDLETLLSKVVVLKDAKGDYLNKAGHGIQFLILVTLSILEKIQSIKLQRGDRGVFEDESTHKKAVSLVLGLDEPEIHLHPYMQRSLIKYLNAVINNQNSDFHALVKDLFDIDNFMGQIIVVTHSPNTLLDNYRQIVRLYSKDGVTQVVSGSRLTLNKQLEKHLFLNFPFIKEAFFSRCAIFVEGASEYASLPLFAHRLTTPVDLDDEGICVIQANGEAVPQLIAIASLFGIPSVGITDRDDGTHPPTLPNHFQTTLRDFEEELVSLVLNSGKEHLLRKVVELYDPKGVNREMNEEALNKRAFERYSAVNSAYTGPLKLADISAANMGDMKSFYLTWFSVNKSYPLGKQIGEVLSDAEIPPPYKTVITKALELTASV